MIEPFRLASQLSSVPFHSNPARILIADDDESLRRLLELTLLNVGYTVLTAADGATLVQMAQEHTPDLMLIDLMMPHLDGFEAIRQLRNDSRTAHLPMLVLTARSRSDDLVQGFKAGADDFIVKPFELTELLARIQANLSRAARHPVNNSLTGLPGNLMLVNNLVFRIGRELPFSLLYCDLDNFKVFNDTYGFTRGDAAICMLAVLLQEALKAHNSQYDFIGHIGGDDFAIITSTEEAELICQHAIKLFDERVRTLYEPNDLQRGYLSGLDRHGVLRRFPLLSLSIGVVSTKQRMFASYEEISQAAAEMKHVAKSRPGSSYAMDMRSSAPVALRSERRGTDYRQIVVISNDKTLVNILRQVLNERGYPVVEAASPLQANSIIARTNQPPLIIADSQLGTALNEVYDELALDQPLLIIAGANEDHAIPSPSAYTTLQQPFTVDVLLDHIEHLLEAHLQQKHQEA